MTDLTPQPKRARDAHGRFVKSAAVPDAHAELAQALRVHDAFSNPAARLGFGTASLSQATEYPLTRITQNYALLNSLYRSNWIIRRIVDTVAKDMCKNWITLQSQVDPEHIDQFNQAQRQSRIRGAILQGLQWGRLYGGAAGLILIDGQHEMLGEPLDLATVMPGAFQGLYIVDRWSGVYPDGDVVTDPSDPDFGLPDTYQVRNENGGLVTRVHHSRLVRFPGLALPYWEELAEIHWGASAIEPLFDEVVRRDNIVNNIAELTFRAKTTTMEMEGLDQLFAVGGQQAQQRFWNVMYAMQVMLSSFGVQVVNEGTKVQHDQFTFSGLGDIWDRLMMDVAGAAGMPVTKLFGRSPSGLNPSEDASAQNYYDDIAAGQENELRPSILDKVLPIIAVSAWGELPDDFDYRFNPVRDPKRADQADLGQKQSAAVISAFNAGGFDLATLRKELRQMADETTLFSNITDEQIEAGEGTYVWDLQLPSSPMNVQQNPYGTEGSESSVDADVAAILKKKSLTRPPMTPGTGAGPNGNA